MSKSVRQKADEYAKGECSIEEYQDRGLYYESCCKDFEAGYIEAMRDINRRLVYRLHGSWEEKQRIAKALEIILSA